KTRRSLRSLRCWEEEALSQPASAALSVTICSGKICRAALLTLLLLANFAPSVEAVYACCVREPACETDERAADAVGVLSCGAVRDGDAGARCRLRSSDPARHRGAGTRDARRAGALHALERLLRRRRV